jgi:hypothetical protein
MHKTLKGVFHDGRIELTEPPGQVEDRTPVLVTFLDEGGRDLRSRGIDADRAAELRARLRSFAEEWESPEMDVYDDYDTARLPAR